MRKHIIIPTGWTPEQALGAVREELQHISFDKPFCIRFDDSKSYTNKQRNAMHLWYRQIAEAFNEAGMQHSYSIFGKDKLDQDELANALGSLIRDVANKPDTTPEDAGKEIVLYLTNKGLLTGNRQVHTPYTEDIIKNTLWRDTQRALYGVERTTELTTEQVTTIANAIEQALARSGFDNLPFPHDEMKGQKWAEK